MPSNSNSVSRRQFLGSCAGAAVLSVGAAPLAAAPSGARRPNVLYVFSDMQRANTLGCYGDPNAHTPALDAFAKQGTLFSAAMSNTPVCCPHRACLMTGLYSHRHGVVSNSVRFTRKARGMAEQFRDAGYVTGYAGKWHIPDGYGTEDTMPLGFPRDQATGPDKDLKPAGPHTVRKTVRDENGVEVEKTFYHPTLQTDEALQFIEQNSQGQAPWLFVLSWVPPHTPYASPPQFLERYKGELILPPNVPKGLPEENARACLPDYYGMCESLDAEFQRLLDALDKAGVADNTIVCYSSDHGDMIGSQGLKAKRWPYEESARVPLIMRYPGRIPAGRVIDDPISTVDLYPTLAALAGLEPPAEIDGLDFSPLIEGKSDAPPRDYAFLQMIYGYVPWPGWRGLRTKEYTYARTVDGPWMLYRTSEDPFQLKNLADDPGSKALVEEMEGRLAAIMRESGDSWDYEATTGDLKNWVPGGSKQKSQTLGTPWPGAAIDIKGNKAEPGAAKTRVARKKANAADSSAEDE